MDRISCVPSLACEAQPPVRAERTATTAMRQPIDLANAAMQRYARGDDSAFAQLYRLLAPPLRGVCRSLAGRHNADDLLQEVFLKIHRARETFTADGNVIGWASTIARTTFLDQLRYSKRRPEGAMDPSRIEERVASQDFADYSLQELEYRLASLSSSLRLAYCLTKIEGLTSAQAAKVLGTSADAIKQRVRRASELLRKGLSEQ